MDGVKEVIWIEEKYNSEESDNYYNIIKINLPKEYNLEIVTSISSAFKLIENNKNKYFFKLFYVIIYGSIADEFFITYTQKSLELNILCYTIIFDKNPKFYEFKPYYKDPFLNPGGVSDNLEYICFIIKKIEFDLNQKFPVKEVHERKDGFGNIFDYSNDLSGICFPLLLGKLINTSLIKGNELEEFALFLLGNYPELKKLTIPSQDKKMEIPKYILTKYYAKIYTEETNFYRDMNKDLSNGLFDTYRVFIFLLYSGLNKKSLQCFYSKNLYRGSVLGKNEFLYLKKNLEMKNLQENKKSEINTPLYFCRNFLSFSKDEEIAFEFLLNSPKNDELIPCIFEIKKLTNSEDFFISNIDVEYISTLKREKEVLFLPLSCFEIIKIKEEKKGQLKYYRIFLEYLYKYKKLIEEHIKKIDQKEGLQEFLNKTIQSKYGLEIIETLGRQLSENLKNYFENHTHLKCNLNSYDILVNSNPKKLKPHFDPNIKGKNPGFSNGAQLNKLYKSEPISIQRFMHKDGSYDVLILKYKDGSSALIKQHPTIKSKIIIIKEFDEIGQRGFYKSSFNKAGKKIPIKDVNTNEIINSIEEEISNKNLDNINTKSKSIITNGCKKSEKMSLIRNGYHIANAFGTSIGYLFANIDRFAKISGKEKAKMLGMSSIPMILTGVSKTSSVISQGIPIIGIGLTSVVFGYQCIENIKSESLTKSEVFKSIFKNIINLTTNFGVTTVIAILGLKIGVTLGTVTGPGAIVIGLAGGLIGGLIGGTFSRIVEDKSIRLKSECLYSGYIPYKYRDSLNPYLFWKNVNKNTKSFALELIENDFDCKWRVINIPPDIRIFPVDCQDIGETVIKYKGISKNANKVYFCIYELKNKEKLNPDDWEDTEKIQKMILNVSILEAN